MKRTYLFLAMSIVAFTACNSNSGTPDNESRQTKQLELSSNEQSLLRNNNQFSINMLSLIGRTEQEKQNICFSPLSASMALGILMNGAGGATLEQMQTALGFEDTTQEEINAYYHKLLEALPALDQTTTVNIANALWLSKKYSLYEQYKQTTRDVFGATIDNVNSFTEQATLDMINRWAAENTNNLIKEVITPDMVDSQTVMVFANALYFKGIWQTFFDKQLTSKTSFYTENDGAKKVDMMYMSSDQPYAITDDAQLLELDYKDGKYCMDILLPNKDIKLNDFLAGLTESKWQNYLDALSTSYDMSVYLPKFRFSYKRELNSDLQKAGIIDAFMPLNADFSRLSETPSHLSLINQNCYIAVDEESTEAAAVTVGVVTPNAVAPSDVFRADHPFVFIIREKKYGTILFTGIVGDPTQE